MSERDTRTYYLSGNKVVAVFDAATNTKDDYKFLVKSPNNNITGQHYNCRRWMWDHKMIESFAIGESLDTIMEHLIVIPDDHPISKIIEMYKLIGALPDATEDWSNDGYLQ